ncbi:Caleosin [Crucibulum laeve]|uniref:Caleosin n=1 Tax=Crucibulum laeve TaxID=68775 RepID=A0A5C3M0L4_9AGAR|nr:Caleosin [Crucibulum laeve]
MVAPIDATLPAPGTGFDPGKNNTALQAHVEFFDSDNDGIIWPSDTYRGCREIKFGIFLALFSTIVIHAGFSYLTWGSIVPDPFFRLKIRYMHKAKHGSDTESYTKIGEFDESRFNYTFDMYSEPPHTHLSFGEGLRMLRGNRNPWDPFGWFAAAFEALAAYLMLWPEDGRMRREDVKAIYDGSIFYAISGRKPKN